MASLTEVLSDEDKVEIKRSTPSQLRAGSKSWRDLPADGNKLNQAHRNERAAKLDHLANVSDRASKIRDAGTSRQLANAELKQPEQASSSPTKISLANTLKNFATKNFDKLKSATKSVVEPAKEFGRDLKNAGSSFVGAGKQANKAIAHTAKLASDSFSHKVALHQQLKNGVSSSTNSGLKYSSDTGPKFSVGKRTLRNDNISLDLPKAEPQRDLDTPTFLRKSTPATSQTNQTTSQPKPSIPMDTKISNSGASATFSQPPTEAKKVSAQPKATYDVTPGEKTAKVTYDSSTATNGTKVAYAEPRPPEKVHAEKETIKKEKEQTTLASKEAAKKARAEERLKNKEAKNNKPKEKKERRKNSQKRYSPAVLAALRAGAAITKGVAKVASSQSANTSSTLRQHVK